MALLKAAIVVLVIVDFVVSVFDVVVVLCCRWGCGNFLKSVLENLF